VASSRVIVGGGADADGDDGSDGASAHAPDGAPVEAAAATTAAVHRISAAPLVLRSRFALIVSAIKRSRR